jgi:hypothetical protein
MAGSRRFASLMALAVMSGCACQPAPAVPAWPTAGPKVAAELQRLDPDEYPATWEWLGRLHKLWRQLEIY